MQQSVLRAQRSSSVSRGLPLSWLPPLTFSSEPRRQQTLPLHVKVWKVAPGKTIHTPVLAEESLPSTHIVGGWDAGSPSGGWRGGFRVCWWVLLRNLWRCRDGDNRVLNACSAVTESCRSWTSKPPPAAGSLGCLMIRLTPAAQQVRGHLQCASAEFTSPVWSLEDVRWERRCPGGSECSL